MCLILLEGCHFPRKQLNPENHESPLRGRKYSSDPLFGRVYVGWGHGRLICFMAESFWCWSRIAAKVLRLCRAHKGDQQRWLNIPKLKDAEGCWGMLRDVGGLSIADVISSIKPSCVARWCILSCRTGGGRLKAAWGFSPTHATTYDNSGHAFFMDSQQQCI
jgi:hypothetical protein